MPNWCVNKLILISEDPVKILEVLEFIQKDKDNDSETGIGTIDFKKIVPEPTCQTDAFDYRNWPSSYWSKKWNATNCRYDSKNNSILFDTAWLPPCPLINILSGRFPEVIFTLKYAVAAIWLAGKCEFEKGEMVVDDSYDVSIRKYDQAGKIFEELLGFDILDSEEGKDGEIMKGEKA